MHKSSGIGFHYGSFLGVSMRANYMRDSYTSLSEIYYEQQTEYNGKYIRQKNSLGIGFLHGNTGSRRNVGTLTAIYSHVYLPLWRRRMYSSSFRISGGLSYVSKPFEPNVNPKNIYIGSHLNVFTNVDWQHRFRLSQKLISYTGLSFTHFSNGAVSLPNKGMNIPSFSAGLIYHFQTKQVQIKLKTSDSIQTALSIYGGGSIKEAPEPGGNYYFVPSLALEWNRKSGKYNKWAGGILFFYDDSRNLRQAISGERLEINGPFQVGVYAGYEFSFGDISIPMQLGCYVINRHNSGILFQQIGIRYQTPKKLTLQLLMKTHTNIAEYLSIGAGWKICSKKYRCVK